MTRNIIMNENEIKLTYWALVAQLDKQKIKIVTETNHGSISAQVLTDLQQSVITIEKMLARLAGDV